MSRLDLTEQHDVVDPLCEVSIDVWQTLRPLLKQQAKAAQ
jgi:hypothetical protein